MQLTRLSIKLKTFRIMKQELLVHTKEENQLNSHTEESQNETGTQSSAGYLAAAIPRSNLWPQKVQRMGPGEITGPYVHYLC